MSRHRTIAAIATAAALGMAVIPGSRGLAAVPRADAGDPVALIEALNKAFGAFVEANDKRIKAIETGRGNDVVQNEKVDRINADITKIQDALDKIAKQQAAAAAGGDGRANLTPEQRAYSKAFDGFFRKGVDAGLRELGVQAALQTQSDPDGGYLVPEEMAAEIDRIATTVSVMRQLSSVINISSSTYKKLMNKGGTQGGWIGETETRPQTNASQLAELSFPSMELYAQPATTQTLLDDSRVDIAAWLGDEVSITFDEQEAAAWVSGTGVNQPRGFLAYETIADTSYEWGKLGFITTGVAAAISDGSNNGVDKLTDLVTALKQKYRQGATFVLNRKTLGAVRKLKTSEGVYLWQPSIQAGVPSTLLGYPHVDDDNMPDIGANTFPIAFGNFKRGYLIVDRFGIRVLRDPFTAKPYVLFYTTKRVGGGVQNFEALKLLKVST